VLIFTVELAIHHSMPLKKVCVHEHYKLFFKSRVVVTLLMVSCAVLFHILFCIVVFDNCFIFAYVQNFI
jgi:hypothetical protein